MEMAKTLTITGKGTNKSNKLEPGSKNELIKDQFMVSTEFNNFFKDSVSDITQLFKLSENVTYSVDSSLPIFSKVKWPLL